MIASDVLRTAAKLWYLRRLTDLQSVPSPAPRADRSDEAGAHDRVLVIGNGYTHGWGVLTQDLALSGQLERALTSRSGRSTRVRHVGAEIMSLAAAVAWLGDEEVGRYDLVLVVLSLNDAVRLTDADAYERDMRRLIARLRGGAGPAVPILVAGIPDVRALPHYGGVAGRLAARSADRLNARVEAVAGEWSDVGFLRLPAPEPEAGRPYGSPAMYSAWSDVFATACAPLLGSGAAREVAAPTREWSWAPAPEVLRRTGTGEATGLESLARAAKDEFGVDLAYVSLIDGGRQHYLANTARGASEVPVELSHCRETMRGDEMVVVENSFTDERFAENPLLDVTQFRFYSGIPLKNAEGVNVGTFCVSSVLPHRRRFVPEERLQRYAEAAEAELRRLAGEEDAAPAEPLPAAPAMMDA